MIAGIRSAHHHADRERRARHPAEHPRESPDASDSARAQHYPVMLDLAGRLAIVIGGGKVAEQKVRELVAAGARVRVVSPTVSAAIATLASNGALEVVWRSYAPGDLDGARLAIAATDDRAVNRAIWEEAERRGVLLNAVDDVAYCHFIAPSVHREGDITITVSTAGRCPTLAVRLRERIARVVGPEHAALARLAGELRESIARRVPSFDVRRRLWYRVVDSDALDQLRRGDARGAADSIEAIVADAERELFAGGPAVPCEGSRDTGRRGVVYLVGAGPGDPGLITARGLELLRTADVVVHDRLVGAALLREVRPDARLVAVGKHGHGASTPQAEIEAILAREAAAGRIVVRLKGGDPFVFGRGAEELQALRDAGLRCEVVPGVTSVVAGPGAAGIPVTHRAVASAFAVVTGHECSTDGGDSTLDWSALARMPTLVVVMGLRALPAIVERLLEQGVSPQTPVAVVSNATLPGQRSVTATLATIVAEVESAGLEQPATVVVGEVVRVGERLGRAMRV